MAEKQARGGKPIALAGAQVLVTGAAGFIGSNFVQHLTSGSPCSTS